MGSAQSVGKRDLGGPGPDDVGPLGYPETLAILEEAGLKATFFLEGWNALHNSRAVHEIIARGHEVAVHGWVHETIHLLDAVDVERVLTDAVAAFKAIGVAPTGFRAPGGKRGPHVLSILQKLNLEYDSSVEHDPNNELSSSGTPLPALLDGDFPTVPWKWSMIDYYHYEMHPQGARTPRQVRDWFVGELDAVARSKSFTTFVFHASVSCCTGERADALRDILRHATADSGIQVVTAGEAALMATGQSVRG